MGSVVGPNYTYAQLEGLWIQYGGSPAAAPMAAAIAMAESGGGANSVNSNNDGSTDRGLWQINSVHGSQSSFDIGTNVRAAINISNNGTNWKPWSTFGNGAFSKYLQSGVSPVGGTTPLDPTIFGIPGTPDLRDSLNPNAWGSAIGAGLQNALAGIMKPLMQYGIWINEVIVGLVVIGAGIFLIAQKSGIVRGIESGVAKTAVGPEGSAIVEGVQKESTKPELTLEKKRISTAPVSGNELFGPGGEGKSPEEIQDLVRAKKVERRNEKHQ